MELLWADLTSDEGEIHSPAWHQDELRETERRLLSGKENQR